MGNLKEDIVKSIKEAREIATRLGFKNVKSAMETNASSFIRTTIDSNARFFDRTELNSGNQTITQNGKTYSIALTDDKLPDETIDFFFNGLIGYYNYKALVDNTKGFYSVYDSAIERDPTIDVVTLVGDAITMEGENSNSLKLDLLYLKNNTLGTLNQKTVGFENALFHIFGAYHEEDAQIQLFIDAICDKVDDAQKGLMKQNIIDCFNRANERFGACENINNACKILIEKFSGVDFDNYHERITKLYEEESAKYPLISKYESEVKNNLLTINANKESISKYNKLLSSLRDLSEVEKDRNKYKIERDSKINALQKLELEEKDARSNSSYSEKQRQTILNQIASDKQLLLDRIHVINKEIIPNLDLEYNILSNNTKKVANIPPCYRNVVDPATGTANKVFVPSVKITIEGKTREVANPEKLKGVISGLESENDKLISKTTTQDAYLIASSSLILYALNFQRLGGEIVEAVQLLEDIGKNNSDLDFNSEQIRQALSISNNLTILSNQDFFDGNRQLLDLQIARKNILFEIQEKYAQPVQDKDGNMVLPEGKLDINLLKSDIVQLCSDKKNPDGSDNIFFGRHREIFEQLGVAVKDVVHTKKINNTNYVNLRLKMLDPKLKDFNFRTKLYDYYKKQGLIPVKEIKMENIKYTLAEEYKPHQEFKKPTTDPPPPPPGEPKKADYCRELRNALNREIDALNGAINKGNLENGANTEFYKKYVETLQKVASSFDYYIGKPEKFEQYQQKLLKTLQNGGQLSEKDFLMIRFCPITNPMLKEYQEKIVAANNSGNKEEIEKLLVGGVRGRGEIKHSNSIFPHPLNEGLKATILTIHNSQPLVNGKFDLKQFNIQYLNNLNGALTNIQAQFKSIFESEDYEKFKDFLTLEIVDGKLTVTNDLYVGKDGKTYTANPYDKTSMEYKSPANPMVDKLPVTAQIYTIGASGDLELIDVDAFKNSGKASENLVEVSPGKYAVESQLNEINNLAVMSMQTNPKIQAPKVQIIPITSIESTNESTNETVTEQSTEGAEEGTTNEG